MYRREQKNMSLNVHFDLLLPEEELLKNSCGEVRACSISTTATTQKRKRSSIEIKNHHKKQDIIRNIIGNRAICQPKRKKEHVKFVDRKGIVIKENKVAKHY